MQWLDIHKLAEPVVVTPGEKLDHSPVIGHAGVFVPDGGREEFEEAPCGLVAGGGDDRRDDDTHQGSIRPPWTASRYWVTHEFIHASYCNITVFMLQ